VKSQSKRTPLVVALCVVVGVLTGYIDAITDFPESYVVAGGAVVTFTGIELFRRPGMTLIGMILFCVTGAVTYILLTR
jgi:hypothetical protein